MAEHLQEAGSEEQGWLRKVLNAIVELENIRTHLNQAFVPMYKGGGRVPVKTTEE